MTIAPSLRSLRPLLAGAALLAASLAAPAAGAEPVEASPGTAAAPATILAPAPEASAPSAPGPAGAAPSAPAAGPSAPSAPESAGATPSAPAAAPSAPSAPAPAAPPGPAPAAEATAPRAASEASLASPASRAVLAVAPPRAAETFWYEPSRPEDADVLRPWNSSVLGAFDPWTKKKVTLLLQMQTLAMEGSRTRGVLALDDGAGGSARVWYEKIRLTQDQLAPRLEWGNWAVAWAPQNAKVVEPASGWTASLKFTEVTISRGFGATVVHDFGIPDVRVGIAWPELYLRVGYSETLKDITPDLKEMSFTSAGIGLSGIGLRVTAGDVLFGEIRVGHAGYHVIERVTRWRNPDPTADDQIDSVSQDGPTLDLLPTFRLGIAL